MVTRLPTSEETVRLNQFTVKSCFHYCSPSSVGLCCSCADKRPLLADYSGYADGIGIVTGTRRAGYCPICQGQTFIQSKWRPETHRGFPIHHRQRIATVIRAASYQRGSLRRLPLEILYKICRLVTVSKAPAPPTPPMRVAPPATVPGIPAADLWLRLSLWRSKDHRSLYRAMRPFAVQRRGVLMIKCSAVAAVLEQRNSHQVP